MATTTTQIFNPSFSNPDDMPEYISIHDRPKRSRGRPTKTDILTDDMSKYILIPDTNKKTLGRPKTCILTDAEKLERLRLNYKKYYYADPERERARKKRENECKKSKDKQINK
jgi:hypothetical protein